MHFRKLAFPVFAGLTSEKVIRPLNAYIVLILLIAAPFAWAQSGAKIVHLSGEVKVRRGVEETWERASTGTLLREIDTILALEDAEAVVEFGDGATFRLGSNAMLDIADLRKVTERELFLYMMSEKVSHIKPRPEKTPLRIGNISAVHGTEYRTTDRDSTNAANASWRLEANGAKAMYAQNLIPNAALKLHKILAKTPAANDCGELRFYLAKSLEALNHLGEARDEYQRALTQAAEQGCDDQATRQRMAEAQKAMARLE